jgi:LytS/YehU family sensor histidine kinase
MFVEYYYRCLSCIFEEGFQLKNLSTIFFSIILNYPIPAIAAGVIIFKRLYKTQQHSVVLEKEKLEAELNFLKSQIHPHFLFNTLNNLYALTLIKSEKAPDVVIKLSELLDYMLYNSNEKVVNLQKEINQLQGYIELEKIRYGDRLDIIFDIQGDLSGKYIAPMILIPFLENSFKHGTSQSINSPFIKITLNVNDKEMNFNIRNSYSPEKSDNINLTVGIGLKNVQRRLELLYSGKHRLDITYNQSFFEVDLTLEFRELIHELNFHDKI